MWIALWMAGCGTSEETDLDRTDDSPTDTGTDDPLPTDTTDTADTDTTDTTDTDTTDTTAATADRIATYADCEAFVELTNYDGTHGGSRALVYDARGRLETVENHDLADVLIARFVSTWRPDDQPSTQVVFNAEGVEESRTTWLYTGARNTTVEQSTAAAGVTLVTTNHFDAWDRIDERENVSFATGDIAWVQLTSWDAAGDPTAERYDYSGDGTIEVAYLSSFDAEHHRETWEYDQDDDGTVQSRTMSIWDGDLHVRDDIDDQADGVVDGTVDYTYDPDGRIAQWESYRGGVFQLRETTTWTCP